MGVKCVPKVSCRMLRELEFRCCEDLAPLPEDFGQLKALESLFLVGVAGITDLPDSFEQLQRLHSLSIYGCYDLSSLPSSLPHLSSLTSLHLNAPNLLALPDGFGRSSCLREFSLCEESFTRLPDSLTLATALQQLALHDLHSLTSLPDDLGNLTSLRELEIERCSQLLRIPDSLCRLSSLTRLTVRDCCALAALPHVMGDGPHSLQHLTLGCNIQTSLPPSFFRLTSLEELGMFQLPCVRGPLPDAFSRFTHLRDLSLAATPHLTALPPSLAAVAPTLTSLRVEFCHGLEELAEEFFGQLAMLESLTLSHLKSLKSLPRSLMELPRLQKLVVWLCSELGKSACDVLVGGSSASIRSNGSGSSSWE
ncbi:unnamed protein product [Closterium sp. Yama58-4]|nr:unnamed protein product [Closterium sp. Yama58-4]